ncbi:uncharacterized protein LOC108739068 isoform X2 [Agrilus planipennis]|uniref:Proteasome assembly chaperone 1 n=1 Tax=Agrilus planipennis TaxID=224129 RepID=A0A1W4X618_AGRPL|nr:uncharacterized protein LOC108739068 isoform X2 [Agrilus planipennis]
MDLFGEIVEPISRALWSDDFMEYPENIGTQLQWKNDVMTVPNRIETLIVIETNELLEIVEHCLPVNKTALNKLKEVQLEVYDMQASTYIVLCRFATSTIYTEITEVLENWLKNSNNIVCLTSKCNAIYQDDCHINEKNTFIRHLTVKPITNTFSQVLKSPNLITGLAAGILTYSMINGLHCTSFMVYLEVAPLDSINTKHVLDLLKCYYKGPIKPYKLSTKLPKNNVYM